MRSYAGVSYAGSPCSRSDTKLAHPWSSHWNSTHIWFSSVGSRNTVEPFDPCRARLSAPSVPNTVSPVTVRLPSAEDYVPGVHKEQCWQPALAGRLPLPMLVAVGAPGCGFPRSSSVCP